MIGILDHRVRGFRVVEIGALSVLLVMVVGVYLSKTGAGRERAEIARVERQITREHERMRLLRAEVAHLEQPERIERLSAHIGLQPVEADHEASPDRLAAIARGEDEAPRRGGARS